MKRIKNIIIAKFNLWRYPSSLNEYLYEWQKIDHRKDRSLSGRDFRLWVYLRENNRLNKLTKKK